MENGRRRTGQWLLEHGPEEKNSARNRAEDEGNNQDAESAAPDVFRAIASRRRAQKRAGFLRPRPEKIQIETDGSESRPYRKMTAAQSSRMRALRNL